MKNVFFVANNEQIIYCNIRFLLVILVALLYKYKNDHIKMVYKLKRGSHRMHNFSILYCSIKAFKLFFKLFYLLLNSKPKHSNTTPTIKLIIKKKLPTGIKAQAHNITQLTHLLEMQF